MAATSSTGDQSEHKERRSKHNQHQTCRCGQACATGTGSPIQVNVFTGTSQICADGSVQIHTDPHMHRFAQLHTDMQTCPWTSTSAAHTLKKHKLSGIGHPPTFGSESRASARLHNVFLSSTRSGWQPPHASKTGESVALPSLCGGGASSSRGLRGPARLPASPAYCHNRGSCSPADVLPSVQKNCC